MSSLLDVLGILSTQVPINVATLLSHVMPLAVSYTLMAVLAITSETRTFRIALWPVVTFFAFRAAFVDWSQGKPDQIFVNGELVRFIMCIPVHALSWALAEKPLVRHLRPPNSSPSTILDALDLVTNLRGVGWDWSRGLYIPRETRPTNRTAFVIYALFSGVGNFLICGILHRAIQTLASGVGSSVQTRTIFDMSLPFFWRYLRSSIITILAGFVGYNGMLMVYNSFTVIGVLLFGQDPAQWPRGLDRPWCSTSLSEFWGRRWHQWFRHTFIVCAYPLQIVFGRSGSIIGAFLASGLAHHLMVIPHDRHSEMWRMFVGFGMMAPGMLVERAFYKATGKKVDGVVGWIWMVSWLVVWYSFAVEGFVKAGMYAQPSPVDHELSVWVWAENVAKGVDAWLHTSN